MYIISCYLVCYIIRGIAEFLTISDSPPLQVFMDCSYLGGPPETSHLYKPLVERVTFLMMILVGEERSETEIPLSRKIVTGGDSKIQTCFRCIVHIGQRI